jgi:hypothetical protein
MALRVGKIDSSFAVWLSVASSLPNSYVPHRYDVLINLFDGLLVREPSSASGACVVLNGLFRLRGPELQKQVRSRARVVSCLTFFCRRRFLTSSLLSFLFF